MSSSEIVPQDEHEIAGTRMPFSSHLEELRSRLFKAVVISVLGLVACFAFNQEILAFIVRPYRAAMDELRQDPTLKTVGVAQGVFVAMKVSFIAGLILTAPFWIWQIWGFIAAGLYSRERRTVYRYAPACMVLFFIGVGFGYWVLLPIGLGYLITFGDQNLVQPWIGLGEYLSFFATLTILLGIAFQLPVAMMGVSRTGLISIEQFRTKRRWVILGIFVVAAVVTPPDPITQTLLAVPLCLLYEIGIVLSWFVLGSKRPPLDPAILRRRAIKLVAVLALGAVLWRPVMSLRARGDAADALTLDREGAPKFSELLAEPELLGETPLHAFRTVQAPDQECWILGGKERFAVIELKIARTKTQIADRHGRHLSVLHTDAGVVSYAFHRPDEVAWDRLLPALETALEYGSDETLSVVHALLPRLTGLTAPSSSENWPALVREFAKVNAGQSYRQ